MNSIRPPRAVLRASFLLFFSWLLTPAALRASVIAAWNELMQRHAAHLSGIPLEARTYAITHLAVAEAVGEAARGSRDDHAARAAVATAAQAVLAELLPAARREIDLLAEDQLAAVPDGSSKQRGSAAGNTAAARIIAARGLDGWAGGVMLPPTTAEEMGRTAKAIADGAEPPRSPWADATPFALKSAGQFEVAVPAFTALDGTVRVNHALMKSRLFEGVNRTLPEGALVAAWQGSSPAAWNRATAALLRSCGATLEQEARVFATLNVAVADAALAAAHGRHVLGTWRSMMMDTWEDARTSPATSAEVVVESRFDGIEIGLARAVPQRVLLPPTFNYPSTSAVIAGAAQAALAACELGATRFRLECVTGDGVSVKREFARAADAARECAFVAALDGRHTRESVIAGYELGARIGKEVARRSQAKRH